MSKFILSAFGDEISPNLQEQIRILRENQISGLECRSVEGKGIIFYEPDEIREFKKRLDDGGIKVSAIGSPIGKILITDDFEPHLELFKKAIETAHIMGTQYIRMFSFFIPKGENPDAYRQEVMERWNHFADVARDSGLVLLHENEKFIYGDTAARCLDLFRTMNSPIVKGIIDPANFVQVGEVVYPDAYRMLKGYTVYLHIKDARYKDGTVTPAGEGDAKIFEILCALYDSGFEGWLSIEPHLGEGSQPGGGKVQFERAVRALKNVVAQVENR